MRSGRLTCTCHLVIFEKIGSCSVSWNPPRPTDIVPTAGVTTTIGVCAQYAAATAVTKFEMPGPFCATIAVGRPLVRDRQESDSRSREEIERVHERGADDARHQRNAFRAQRFDERLAGRHPRERPRVVGSFDLGWTCFQHVPLTSRKYGA